MRTMLSLSLVTLLAACSGGRGEPENPQPTAPPLPTPTPPPVTTTPTAPPTTTAAPATPAPPKPDVEWTGLSTPEGVIYDAEGDRYLVSNINGKPLEADNNGFISELSPDGKVKTLKLIEGGQKKVTLNAPKGMALLAGVLYVADIDTVRMFDAKTWAPKGEIKIPGATFLNDMVAGTGKDAPIYLTDSGMKQGAADFEPTGTDAVYVIEKGKAKALAKGTDLNRPNGVVITPKGVLVSTFGAAEVYRLGKDGKKEDVTKTPKGGLDGIAWFKDEVIVSSWQGEAIYKGPLGGTLTPMLEGLKAPADFAIDTKRNLVIVPRFLDNTVQGFRLR